MAKLTNIHPIHCTPNSYLFYGILHIFFSSLRSFFFWFNYNFYKFRSVFLFKWKWAKGDKNGKKTSGFLPRTKCMLCIKVIVALVVRIVKSHHSRPTTIVYYDGVCSRANECWVYFSVTFMLVNSTFWMGIFTFSLELAIFHIESPIVAFNSWTFDVITLTIHNKFFCFQFMFFFSILHFFYQYKVNQHADMYTTPCFGARDFRFPNSYIFLFSFSFSCWYFCFYARM